MILLMWHALQANRTSMTLCATVDLAYSDGRHFDSRPSLSGHCGRGWTFSLPGPVANDTRQSQDGTVK
jgi:hypothetical protein